MEALAAAVAGIAASLAALAAVVAEDTIVINATGAAVTGIGTELAAVHTAVGLLQTEQTTQGGKIDALKQQIKDHGSNQTSIIARVGKNIAVWQARMMLELFNDTMQAVLKMDREIIIGTPGNITSDVAKIIEDVTVDTGYTYFIKIDTTQIDGDMLQLAIDSGEMGGDMSQPQGFVRNDLEESYAMPMTENDWWFKGTWQVTVRSSQTLVWLEKMINYYNQNWVEKKENNANMSNIVGMRTIVDGVRAEVNNDWVSRRIAFLVPMWFSGIESH